MGWATCSLWRTDATNLVVLYDRVRDSKATTPKQREALFDDLCLLPHAVAMRSAHQLAIRGLDECNWEVFAECAQALSQSSDCLHGAAVVLDGDCAPLNHYLACYCTAKAESLSATVAAASIIAKVTRARGMIELGKAFPQYGFEKHKGYGTPQHAAAIKAYGVIPGVHRLDFIPRGLF